MILSYSNQMREIDKQAIDERAIAGVELMSNAAEHIAAAALEHIPMGGCVAAICGTGNNGGDGIGAAAYMMEKGVPVRVFLVGDIEKLTPDSKEMLERYVENGGTPERFSESESVDDYLSGCDVIIDAMFGIGLNSDIQGDALTATKIVNASKAFVISADIPSGVHADTGAILGEAIKADMTVTFTLAKPGHFIEPGCTRCGELRVCDIGIPRDIINSLSEKQTESKPSATSGNLSTHEAAQQIEDSQGYSNSASVHAIMPGDVVLPQRRLNTHKGDYGRCLIISGSVGYTGAPALCARSATRMGAGLVFLGVPESIYGIMATKLDEEMPFPLPSDDAGKLTIGAAEELIRRSKECDTILIGPGLGRSSEVSELVISLVLKAKVPVILDADGLNAISGNLSVISEAACPVILTPHVGEFLRLGGDLSRGDRIGAALSFSKQHGCVLVLKGHRTIIAHPDGTAYINTTGGPAMAKGGSGDVLAGMVAALVGQKIPLKDAVKAAVFIHGLAGDLCAIEFGEVSVTAGDIISMLPKAILSLHRRS